MWVYDISTADKATLYIHERFQLWESTISGLMIDKNKELLSLSKVGIEVVALGDTLKRGVTDFEG